MPKYLFVVSYTAEGIRGVQKDGGTARRKAAEEVFKSVGGSVEGFYFAFGETDAYVFGDLPDNESAAAAALTVSGSGAIAAKTVVLITPEEMDAAAKRSVTYRPPGA
jgi:uncharacterized protein with GYD domain